MEKVTFHILAGAAVLYCLLPDISHPTKNNGQYALMFIPCFLPLQKHYAAFRKTRCLLVFSCLFAA